MIDEQTKYKMQRRGYSRYYGFRVTLKLLGVIALIGFSLIFWWLFTLQPNPLIERKSMKFIAVGIGLMHIRYLYKILKFKIKSFEEWNDLHPYVDFSSKEVQKKIAYDLIDLGKWFLWGSMAFLVFSWFNSWGSLFGFSKGLGVFGSIIVSLPWYYPILGLINGAHIPRKVLSILGVIFILIASKWKIVSISYFGKSASVGFGWQLYFMAASFLIFGIITYSKGTNAIKLQQSIDLDSQYSKQKGSD